jgi:hypothetical protein
VGSLAQWITFLMLDNMLILQGFFKFCQSTGVSISGAELVTQEPIKIGTNIAFTKFGGSD